MQVLALDPSQELLVLGEESYAGGGYAVTRCIFDQIHRFVGQVQEFGFGAGIAGVGRYADAGGYVSVDAGVLQPDGFANEFVEAAGYP